MENQIVDWKEIWKDEYLAWICGFANAQGGKLEIGRNNDGKVVGLANPQKLMDDLPNKIKSTMGIVPEINLLNEKGLPYIVINVMPYPNAISYRGRYYLRSGSTTQELTGFALDELMLRKYGRTWDSAPIVGVTTNDLDIVAFREFRKKSLAKGRLNEEDLDIPDEQLVKNLKLTDGNYLKRAAILAFHEDPETWVTGAYVKIGYFRSDTDLVFQDEVHGPLILMPDKVVDLLYDKYFKGIISYKGLQRIETYPVHPDAMRETILNAIVHKDYASGNPIQIRVYDDKITVFNSGKLPADWSIEKLMELHNSDPHNPNIANTFFRSGMTEAWGRGIEKIITSNVEAGKPVPKFETIGSGLRVTFISDNGFEDIITGNKFTEKFTEKFTINETQKKILDLILADAKITRAAIAEQIGMTTRGVQKSIDGLRQAGLVERIGSAKSGHWVVNQIDDINKEE